MRFGVSAGLLASAFSPVAVVLALVAQPLPELWMDIVLAVVLALPLLFIPLVLRATRRLQEERLHPVKVRRRDADNLPLLSSFVFPLTAAFFTPDTARAAASFAVLALLMIVYARAGLQYLNPVLIVIGYRLYGVELDNGSEVFVLTRRRYLPQNQPLDVHRFSDSIFIEGSRP